MTATKGASASRKTAPRNLSALLRDTGGIGVLHSPYGADASRELWNMLREEYSAVIEPDTASEHYVRLRFEVDGVTVHATFFRKDVGVKTTATVDRYLIEGEVSA